MSQDEILRIVMRQFIEYERLFKRIEEDPNAPFLNWKEETAALTRSEKATIIVKARDACKKLDVMMRLESPWLVFRADGLEKKTNSAVGIDRYLTEKVLRLRSFRKLLDKENHGPTFALLEDNLVSNRILIDARTTRSDAFFRFVVAQRLMFSPRQQTLSSGIIKRSRSVRDAKEMYKRHWRRF
jgi:hypothetical protein